MKDLWLQGYACLWLQGYACGIAQCAHQNANTEHREALESADISTVKQLRDAGVDAYDIEILKPIVKEIQRRNKRKKNGG